MKRHTLLRQSDPLRKGVSFDLREPASKMPHTQMPVHAAQRKGQEAQKESALIRKVHGAVRR